MDNTPSYPCLFVLIIGVTCEVTTVINLTQRVSPYVQEYFVNNLGFNNVQLFTRCPKSHLIENLRTGSVVTVVVTNKSGKLEWCGRQITKCQIRRMYDL